MIQLGGTICHNKREKYKIKVRRKSSWEGTHCGPAKNGEGKRGARERIKKGKRRRRKQTAEGGKGI